MSPAYASVRSPVASEEGSAPSVRLRPLTERIRGRLPGADAVWILVWALVPWLNAVANLALGGDRTSAVWEQSDVLVVLNYVSLSVGVVVTLWGTRRTRAGWRRLSPMRPASSV
jgi:hypothetical protein